MPKSRQSLRSLAAKPDGTAEVYRQGLVMELHDQVGQNLTVLGINLHLIRSRLPEDASISRLLDDSLGLVEQVAASLRSIMDELSECPSPSVSQSPMTTDKDRSDP